MRGSHGDARLRQRARSLRAASTDAERKLWSRLRSRQVEGFKFVRQYAVGPYFTDFVCRDEMLVVEVDGGQHSTEADIARTRFLNAEGFSVLRFWNNEVLTNTDGVLEALLLVLKHCPSADLRFAPATLSPAGRGDAGGTPSVPQFAKE
ncbi:endonuclease domain-containing protein [Devosia sp.]|uniref:endonuclease domain-containing protein n=1 Tax=Devosia sp. TaxID=1871048 RepID=UPI003BAC10EB